VAVALLAMFAFQVYVSGSVDSWSAAGAFGHRRFVGTTVILVVGLASLARRAARQPARLALAAGMVLCAWWNLALIVQFGTGMMNRQQLDLRRNARMAFVDVPALIPDLARRYLFDRASFYAPPGGRE
jgi:dipeptide/tripeptide permease